MGAPIPKGKGQFLWVVCTIEKHSELFLQCTKMAEPSGADACGPKNHVVYYMGEAKSDKSIRQHSGFKLAVLVNG